MNSGLHKIIKYLKNYNSGIVDYRLHKMAAMLKEREYILDLGFVDIPNLYLKNKKIVGIDIQKANVPDNYHSVVIADVMELSKHIEKESVDAIFCGELLEHLENPIHFLRECQKVLKKNGKIVLSTPNPHYFWEIILTIILSKKLFYTRDHVCLYPQRWLIRMFEMAGFSQVKILSGGIKIPYLGTIPFFRTFGYYTIVTANKS